MSNVFTNVGAYIFRYVELYPEYQNSLGMTAAKCHFYQDVVYQCYGLIQLTFFLRSELLYHKFLRVEACSNNILNSFITKNSRKASDWEPIHRVGKRLKEHDSACAQVPRGLV